MTIDYSNQFFEGRSFRSCFDRTFDVVVFGGGFAGYAAASGAQERGDDVLLVDTRGVLLWESSGAGCLDAGSSKGEAWRSLLDKLSGVGSHRDGVMRPGPTEVAANRNLLERRLPTLYYASPVAIDQREGRIHAVAVSTRGGVRALRSKQWIDATESGLLLRMAGESTPPREAECYALSVFLQAVDWPRDLASEIPVGDEPSSLVAARLTTTGFKHERAIACICKGKRYEFSLWILEALRAYVGAVGEFARSTHLSHASMEPLPVYEGAWEFNIDVPENLLNASPGYATGPVKTLADRFELGIGAAQSLRPSADSDSPSVDWVASQALNQIGVIQERQAGTVIAGLGTAGSIAAIAAGRLSREVGGNGVMAVEPGSFAGGIGTAGGIHRYWHGVQGGLQQEVDNRVRDLVDEYGKLFASAGFHPVAKRIVLTDMLQESGVDALYGAEIFRVEKSGDRVTSAFATTPQGVVRIDASSWLDCTGDAVLTIQAGGQYELGRAGDGLPNPFSQTSGYLRSTPEGLPLLRTTNFDAGWCDPLDSEDLTRARMLGVDHYFFDLQKEKEEDSRLLYIAPAVGLRQGPRVKTDYTLTLRDGMAVRRFSDAIGFSCCRMDTHNPNLYFDNDPAIFWRWVLRNQAHELATQVPYRILLPVGLGNVWIASRGAGFTQEMFYVARQMREMQRIGEPAGIAAVLAATRGCGSREIDFLELKRHLEASGALEAKPDRRTASFGKSANLELFSPDRAKPSIEMALAKLDAGETDRDMWILDAAEESTRADVRKRLTSGNWETRFLAAGIAAQWGDEGAEPVLIEALDTAKKRPLYYALTALALLRKCGTAGCVEALDRFATDLSRLSLDLRNSVAVAIEGVGARSPLGEKAELARNLLDRLLERPIPLAAFANYVSPMKIFDINEDIWKGEPPKLPATARTHEATFEDHTWQLELAVARARKTMGDEPQASAGQYRDDPRGIVRRAFDTFVFCSEKRRDASRLLYR